MAADACKVPVIVHTFHGHVFHSYFSPIRTALYKNIERFLARRSSKVKSNVYAVDADTFPQTLAVLRTRAEPLGIDVRVVDLDGGELPEEYFGLHLQYPGASGAVGRHTRGALSAGRGGFQLADDTVPSSGSGSGGGASRTVSDSITIRSAGMPSSAATVEASQMCERERSMTTRSGSSAFRRA